ncbi:MAG: hypothetical protein AAFP19_25435 [Bacteroidota bacterium]
MLAESTIQEAALRYLSRYYRKSFRKGEVFAKTEVRTRHKYGGKRADGLIAFRHWIWGTYVISMEAKSLKTLSAIKPYRDDWKLMYNALKAGFMACLLTGAFLALYRLDDGWLQFAIPLNIFVIAGLIYAVVTFNSSQHKVVKVIDQVLQYPANEQWLALCKTSVDHLSAEKWKKLKVLCRNNQIGILVVDHRKRVDILVNPRRHWRLFGDFLTYYSKEQQIRKEIA